MFLTRQHTGWISSLTPLLGICMVAACNVDRLASASVHSAPRHSASALLTEPHRMVRGIEDDILRIEEDVPGFGGFSLDSAGNLRAYILDIRQVDALRARLVSYTTEVPGRFTKQDGTPPSITILQGAFAFSDLVTWQTALRAAKGKSGQIVLLDADEASNRVRVGVRSQEGVAEVSTLLAALAIPENAVLVEIRSSPLENYTTTLQDKYRPLGAGIQTHSGSDYCTMGFNVVDSLGNHMFLTASHCTGLYNGTTGTIDFYQNTVASNNHVGMDYINPAWSTGACSISGAIYCSTADVALVLMDSASMLNDRIAQSSVVGTGSSDGNLILGTWLLVGTADDAASGTTVYKTGRTGGSTSGPVSGTCMDVGPFVPGYTEVTCAYEVSASSEGGDSGGPVYHFRFPLLNNARQADGILFGGTNHSLGVYKYYYNSWSVLVSRLGRSLTPY